MCERCQTVGKELHDFVLALIAKYPGDQAAGDSISHHVEVALTIEAVWLLLNTSPDPGAALKSILTVFQSMAEQEGIRVEMTELTAPSGPVTTH